MGNFLVTQGIRRKYSRELRGFFTTIERSIDTFFVAFGYDAWLWKKKSKRWQKLIQVCVEHTNQGLGYMIALRGWVIIGPLWCKIA